MAQSGKNNKAVVKKQNKELNQIKTHASQHHHENKYSLYLL